MRRKNNHGDENTVDVNVYTYSSGYPEKPVFEDDYTPVILNDKTTFDAKLITDGDSSNSSQVTQRLSAESMAQVRAIIRQAKASQKEALSGAHLEKTGELFGKNFSNLTSANTGVSGSFAEGSVEDYLALIIDTAKKSGLATKVALTANGTLKLGFYPEGQYKSPKTAKWEKISSVEVGLVDAKGAIGVGDSKAANILYPHVSYQKDAKGKTIAIPRVSSAQEEQFNEILGLFGGINRDVSNPTRFVQNVQSRHIEKASAAMAHARDRAVFGAPTAYTSTTNEEGSADFLKNFGKKNNEQSIALRGMVSTRKLAENFLNGRKAKEVIDALYKSNAVKRYLRQYPNATQEEAEQKARFREFDPYNISSSEYKAVIEAYALISQLDTKQIANQAKLLQQGSLLRELLTSDDFKYFRQAVQQLSQNGIFPDFEPLKEESFLSSFFTLGGAKSVNPLAFLGDPSNRAISQTYNYQERAKDSKIGRKELMGQTAAEAFGVNYNSAEMTQYTGMMMTPEEFRQAASALENFTGSIKEGGIVISQQLAEELASYRESRSKLVEAENINDSFFEQGFLTTGGKVFDRSILNGMKDGQTVLFEGATGESTFSKDITTAKNDVILGVQKIGESYRLISKTFDEVGIGTKLLGMTGQRMAVNQVLPQKIIDQITRQEGVQFIAEKEKLSARKLMEHLQGRLSYMFGEASSMGKSVIEIYDIMAKTSPTLAKIFKVANINGIDRFAGNAEYDARTQEFSYFDANEGIWKPLFDSMDEIATLVDETLDNSQLKKLGEALLRGNYQNTRNLYAQAINMAKEYPYYNSMGAGSVDTVEQGRVKFGEKERLGFLRGVYDVSKQVYANEGSFKGLNSYLESEKSIQNSYGEIGKKAQKQAALLKRWARDGKPNSLGGLPRKQEKYLRLVWGNATSDTDIDISKILPQHLEYHGQDGVLQEDFDKTLAGIISARIKTLAEIDSAWNSASVQLDLGTTGLDIRGNNKVQQLAVFGGRSDNNGYYMPSFTDSVLNGLVQPIQDAVVARDVEALNSLVTNIRQEYIKEATDKDSALFKKATESKVPNASYVHIVNKDVTGLTDYQKGDEKVRASLENSVSISGAKLASLIRTQEGGSIADYQKNLTQLSYLLRANGISRVVGKNGGFYELKDFDFSNIKTAKKLTKGKEIEDLKQYEDIIIQAITDGIRNGKVDLTGQIHRYPSISGSDIHHTRISIDDALGQDTMSITRGASLSPNADYDGDKMWVRALTSGIYKNFEEYEEAYKAIQLIRQAEDKKVQLLAEWERASDAEKAKNGDAAQEKDRQALVADLWDRFKAQQAAVISRSNKAYVGQFSNVSSRLRDNLTVLGLDELNQPNSQMSIYSKMVRAFTQTLEQEGISAKKVYARLAGENGDKVAFDELQGLYDLLSQGDLASAVTRANELGILQNEFFKSQIFEDVRASIESNKESYDTGVYSSFAKAASSPNGILDLLSTSIKNIESAAREKGYSLLNLVREKVDFKTLKGAQAPLGKILLPAQVKKKQKRTKESRGENKNPSETAGIAVGIFTPIQGKYIHESEDYNKTHGRYVTDEFGNVKWTTDETESVTTILRAAKKTEQFGRYNEAIAKKAAAKGTYQHAIMEQLVKEKKYSIEELSPEAKSEISKALEELKQELGADFDQEVVDSLNKKVAGLIEFAKKEALFSGDVESEVKVGGKFERRKAITGSADLIKYDPGYTGVTVGDWKFSNDASASTLAERVLQASIYARLEEQGLIAELEELQSDNANGKNDTEIARIQDRLQAYKNAKIKIMRAYEKDGQVFEDIFEMAALEWEQVSQVLHDQQVNGKNWTTAQVQEWIAASGAKLETRDSSGGLTIAPEERKGLQNSFKNQTKQLAQEGTAYQNLLKIQTEYQNALEKGEDTTFIKEKLDILKEQLGLEDKQVVSTELLTKRIEEQAEALVKTLQEYKKYGLYDDSEYLVAFNDIEKSRQRALSSVEKAKKFQPSEKEQINLVKQYLNSYKQKQKIEQEINQAQLAGQNYTGTKRVENQNYIAMLKNNAEAIKLPELSVEKDSDGNEVYMLDKKRISQEQYNKLKEEQKNIDAQILKAGQNQLTQLSTNKNLFQKIVDNFKNSFAQMQSYLTSMFSVQSLQRIVQSFLQETQQLDSAMVDLQIASGETRTSIKSMMTDFNKMAISMGKSTTEIAQAANDWLRAGYTGKEAAELTNASMSLATLGQINSAEATSNLISVLKGWKLSTEDVIGVVDKLVTVDLSAAVSAGEIAKAMSRGNNVAQSAGTSLDRYIGYITTIADLQKSKSIL